MGILTSFTGKGHIFCLGGSAEEVVLSYNDSSAIHFQYDDYRFITEPIGSFSDIIIGDVQYETIGTFGELPLTGDLIIDYGLVSELRSETNDFGYITWSNHESYGTLSTTDEADASRTVTVVGSGSIFVRDIALVSSIVSETFTSEYTSSEGSLFTFISHTESSSYSPDDTKVLFSIGGSGEESTKTDRSGSGLVSVYQKSTIVPLDGKERLVGAYERSVFAAASTGKISINDNALTIFKSGFIGEGLTKLYGSSNESVTPTPFITSGSLFTFISHTESSSYSPDDTKSLFSITGSATDIRYIPEHTGSGSLFTFISHTESSSYSPDDTKSLFSITGSANESTATERFGFGLIDIEGVAQESYTKDYIASGSLFTFVSHTETSSYSPDDTKVLFSITGSASNVKYIPEHTGSGTLIAFTGSAESSSYSPDDTKTLFSITGNAKESTATKRLGSGTIEVYQKSVVTPFDGKERLVGAYESVTKFKSGKAEIKFTGSASSIQYIPEHSGSGSLFAFTGSAESSSYSPDDTKVLFSINGSANEAIVKAPYIGSTSLSISGRCGESITPSAYVSETSFIDINGNGTNSSSPSSYIGSGSLFTVISSSIINAYSPKGNGLFNITGGLSSIKYTSDYSGSGGLYAFTGASESVFYDYGVSQKAFKIFGSTFESFIKSNYNGSTFTHLSGKSQDEKVDFVPSKKTRLIII